MSKSPWTKIFWADFIGDTMDLSAEEIGVYMLLLARYYQREEPIPADLDVIYRICRATTKGERASVDRVLDGYFVRCEGAYWNKRADKEIAKRQTLRENGSKGGRPKLREVK